MKPSTRNILAVILTLAAVGAAVLIAPHAIRAQRAVPPVAQVGVGSPLPVYVVNDPEPRLPGGFVPGTSWKFTSWTTPSSLTFVVSVQATSGGWASLTLSTDPEKKPKWYYVPQMPGAWELQ